MKIESERLCPLSFFSQIKPLEAAVRTQQAGDRLNTTSLLSDAAASHRWATKTRSTALLCSL